MKLQIEGRCAVVLGGTSGIGLASARLLAEEGASVVVQGRDPVAGEEVARRIRNSGATALFAEADIYDYSSVDNVLARCEECFGGLDIVVASGGQFYPPPQEFVSIAPEQLESVISSRLFHRLNAVHAAAVRMRRHHYGKIITLSTEAGRTPTPLEAVIGAGSAAVSFLVRSAARELAPEGIRLNNVSVTLTTGTPSHERHLERIRNQESRGLAGVFTKLEKRTAFGLCSPADIAPSVAFLASPLTDKITGATVSINGGSSYPAYS